jgi:hypothetical protein
MVLEPHGRALHNGKPEFGILNPAPGDKIDGEAAQPVSAFIMLAGYGSQSGAPMRCGTGRERLQPRIVRGKS